MLKKLYRHEFHALFRSLWPLYAGLLVLALLSRLMDMSFFDRSQLVVQILYSSFMSLYVLGIVAMLIISFAVVIVRFYRHLLTSEGYLSFTLPFTAGQHITCKLVCGVVASLVSFAFTVLSLLILSLGTSFMDWEGFFTSIWWFLQSIPAWQAILLVVEMVLLIPMALCQSLSMFYVSMAIGQQCKNRVGGAVLAYLAIEAALQILAFAVIMPLSAQVTPLVHWLVFMTPAESALTGLSVALGISLILSAIYYLVTRHLLTHKLNLE